MNLQLSRTSDYAVRLMVRLAMEPERRPVPLAEIARSQGIPEAYLQKILPDLAHKGLVTARRGPRGGFSLARSPEEITLLQVIEAADGPVGMNVCVMDGGGCSRSARCPVHRLWRIAQRTMVALLDETDLWQLAAEGHYLATLGLSGACNGEAGPNAVLSDGPGTAWCPVAPDGAATP